MLSSLTPAGLLNAVILTALVVLSIVIHEVSHGYVAYLCGDTTAKVNGRLTLNPLKHLDPFGSVILPLILSLIGGPVFAYAKPVPYNPNNLRHPRNDELLVALAGPFSNFLQALFGIGVFMIFYNFFPELLMGEFSPATIALDFVWINLMLMFFNLIPIPPLDGSSIIGWFLPQRAMSTYYKIQAYSLPILLIVLFVLPMVLDFSPLNWYIANTAQPVYRFLVTAALA